MEETKQFERPDWHTYFMTLAAVAAMRSPDPTTKCGAVIVDPHNRILGFGYNGFPRGGKDIYPKTRPEKYRYVAHAEQNAIWNSGLLHDDKNVTLYATSFPCHGCMIAIIQTGIKRVVYGPIGSVMVDPLTKADIEAMAVNHGVELLSYEDTMRLLISPVKLRPHDVLSATYEYLEGKGWKR